jgi:hypothetical protein
LPVALSRELTVSEKTILADGFTSGLNDPDSVKFKWTKVPKLLNGAGAPFEYCAQLDMKNAKGTYNGMQPFLATIRTSNGAIPGGAIAALSTDNRPEFRLCQQKGLDNSPERGGGLSPHEKVAVDLN